MRLRRTLIVVVALVGCAGGAAREADRPFTGGLARVESVEVEVRRAAPASAWARVRGELPDACTALEPPEVRRSGSVFRVYLATRRPFGARCAPEAMPFEERIRLDVDEAISGAYVVDVNGVSQSFAVHPRGAGPLF